ncbi:MAG: hypothetical protein GXY85_11840 [Candidatus Brocadiaceae bacterium]|nr:hypothetical protein [Candidatus Brocadiaceae bacterium]
MTRTGVLLSVAAAVVLPCLVGCSCEETPQTPPQVRTVEAPEPPEPAARAAARPPAPSGERGVGESLLSTPGDYLRTTVVTAPRYARSSVADSVLTHDLEQYRAMHGEYPPSLAALAEWTGRTTPAPPGGFRYAYDPKTGRLDVVRNEP